MKQLMIAANWKSNKTTADALLWLQDFDRWMAVVPTQWITLVLCAPFTLLYTLKEALHELSVPVALGAENVSAFDEGPHTGEVSATMIKEFADWVIIGHSERRKNFCETDVFLKKKVERAITAGLQVIYCVPDEHAFIPKHVTVVAYEPVHAIGTGTADDPDHANAAISAIKARSQVDRVLYGGSVSSENVQAFVSEPSIDGILSGKASLDAREFSELIQKAQFA